MRYSDAAFAALLMLSTSLSGQTPAPVHGENFDSERQQANELFLAHKPLEALPLYEDLCRQDGTIAVFAERHAAGLFAKEATEADPAAKQRLHDEGYKELKRAQSLGDNSAYVQDLLALQAKTFVGAVISGVPLTVGYTHDPNAAAQAPFREAEAAFGRSEWEHAAGLYVQAAQADPTWYNAALFAGDSYFRVKDWANAGTWFAKAIAIDPDRETAYRYWGDALAAAGDQAGARAKFVSAFVAEPYSRITYNALEAWIKRNGRQLVHPTVTRPEFTTPNGELKIDPALEASTQDGRSSWILYQQYRVAHGARVLTQVIVAGSSDKNAVLTPSGYRHTIAEEHAALRAMLEDIDAKLKDGRLQEAELDPSIKNLRQLEHNNVLGAWIALNAADAGIRSDYAEYRAKHREHLEAYVDGYLIR